MTTPRYFVAILGAEGFGQDPQRTPIKVNHLHGPFASLEESQRFAAEREGFGDEVLVLKPHAELPSPRLGQIAAVRQRVADAVEGDDDFGGPLHTAARAWQAAADTAAAVERGEPLDEDGSGMPLGGAI